MSYLDILFHNIQQGGLGRINTAASRANYTTVLPSQMNVLQTPTAHGYAPGGAGGAPVASLAWGANITGGANACGMFFCESSPYPGLPNPTNYHDNWRTPPSAVPNLAAIGSLAPSANLNQLCAFLEGVRDAGPLPAPIISSIPGAAWLGKSDANCALHCVGTGDPTLYGAHAPPGSDRYALYFEATNRTYPGGIESITGVFVHVKNTDADPGTQIAALCRQFPQQIIFGDLNLDIRCQLKAASLQAAIARTHALLALQQCTVNRLYYATHGNTSLDYALVPNAYVNHVELWAHDNGGGAYNLNTNGSDHSVMMLRIHCV